MGDSVSVQAGVASPTEDTVSYGAEGLPPGLTINGDGVITGTIANDANTSSAYSVTVAATEAGTGASATETFNWFVGTAATAAAAANIEVTLPTPNAAVTFDGAATQSTGIQRLYTTPSVQGAASYTVAATWQIGGFTVEDRRQVQVTPENTTQVDFTQPGPNVSVSARIMVILPNAQASVTVDGAATSSTGTTRYYDTPALQWGSTGSYTLVVNWTDSSGQAHTVQRQVTVTPGRLTRVDLSPPVKLTESAPGTQAAAVNYRLAWTGCAYALEVQNNDGTWTVLSSGTPGISRADPIVINDGNFTLEAPNLEGLWVEWQGTIYRAARDTDGSLGWALVTTSRQGGLATGGSGDPRLNAYYPVPPPPGPAPDYMRPRRGQSWGGVIGAGTPGGTIRSGFGAWAQWEIPPLYQAPPFRWIYAPPGWQPSR